MPSNGQLCQAAEGRGTQCLARPPGGTGSSGAQGPRSEYTAKPQLAAPKGGYGPARPSGRWACPPGGCSYVGGCPVSSGWLAWRGAQAQELRFCIHEQSADSAINAISSNIPHSAAPTSTARKEPNESNRRSTRPTMSADAHGRNATSNGGGQSKRARAARLKSDIQDALTGLAAGETTSTQLAELREMPGSRRHLRSTRRREGHLGCRWEPARQAGRAGAERTGAGLRRPLWCTATGPRRGLPGGLEGPSRRSDGLTAAAA